MQAASLGTFPPEIVKLILSRFVYTKHLQPRAKLALVCKSFAAALRELPHVEASSTSLRGSRRLFSVDPKNQLDPTFRHVTQLHLQDVNSYVSTRMFRIVKSCPLLEVLNIELQSEDSRLFCPAEPPIFAYLWQLLECKSTEVPRLRQLTVKKGDRMVLEAVSCKGPLSEYGSLECIIGCSLDVLRGLAHCLRKQLTVSSVMCEVDGYHTGSSDAETDQAMLSEYKWLQWLDIGNQPLHAAFTGTVYGSLTPTTAPTLRVAKEAHLHCVYAADCIRQHVPPVETVLSLKHNMQMYPEELDGLLPQLQHLDIHILCGYHSMEPLIITFCCHLH